MKSHTITIDRYSFDELSEQAQNKALNEFINDRLKWNCDSDYENWPNFKKAVDDAQAMQTPWFTNSFILDYCKDEIVVMLKEEGEVFTKDGTQNHIID